MEPKFIYFESYGCTANQNNTEIMKGLVLQAGLQITNNPNIADILVINSCIVKGPTEKKIERRISDITKLGKPIIIAGCMPEVRSRRLQRKNIYLLGTHHIKDIAKLIRKIYEDKYEEYEFLAEKNEIKLCQPKIPQKDKTGITQILEGCLGNCSFCITRFAKGKLFSYPEDKIFVNVERDIKSGCKEIWITSQDNAAYGLDSGKRKLPELIENILKIKGKFTIRLGMMNPENVLPILPGLIRIYKNKKMKKFLHIPLQSGSDRILKLMNRKYKVKDFLKIIETFQKEIPDIIISTDVIAAFPTETEQDFQKTIEIINKIKPGMLNLNRYWQMKGTKAAGMKQVSKKDIKDRVIKLMQIYRKITNK